MTWAFTPSYRANLY